MGAGLTVAFGMSTAFGCTFALAFDKVIPSLLPAAGTSMKLGRKLFHLLILRSPGLDAEVQGEYKRPIPPSRHVLTAFPLRLPSIGPCESRQG